MSPADIGQVRSSKEVLHGDEEAHDERTSQRTPTRTVKQSLELALRVLVRRPSGAVATVARLLTTGYASEDEQRRYERSREWEKLRATLLRKIEHISVVSGLLLGSSATLLVSGDLKRMTYTATVATIYGSVLSIIFGLLCLWILLGIRNETDMQVLTQYPLLFYYLFGSPSLFGGASALVFFVAVGAWTWLDQAGNANTRGGKVTSIIISVILLSNAGMCFVLGCSKYIPCTVVHDRNHAGS